MLALPRLMPMVAAALPLYVVEKLRVLLALAERLKSELPKEMPEIVELVRPELFRVPVVEGVKVNVPPVFVMEFPRVRPLKDCVDVPRVMAPAWAEPYVWARERTPEFESVTLPPKDTVPPPPSPEPAETVTEEFCNCPFPMVEEATT